MQKQFPKSNPKEEQKFSPVDPKTLLTAMSKKVQHDFTDEFAEDFEKFVSKNVSVPDETGFDDEIYNLSVSDKGNCLSMLQPWASLLIEGFKRFEGRA